MSALIKGLNLLTDTLSEKDIDKMEMAAALHKRHSNITFKIIDLMPGKVIIQAVQGKSSAENYFTQKRLVEIVHESFARFFPGKKINVHATPYSLPAPAKVNSAWVNNQMLVTGTKLKDVAADSGIDYTQLSNALNEENELSKPMKAFFWYYFKTKELTK